jgi:quercetin dioxygenase-like cupin family protein
MESIWFIADLAEILHRGRDLDVVRLYAPPGDQPPLHLHADADETFYVLEGEVTVWVGDSEPVVLGPADFAFAPRGVPHTYRVTSDGPARVLVTSTPGGFADFVRAYGVPAERHELPVLDGPPDVERLGRLAAEHGITLLGPPGMLPAEAAAAAA